MISIHAPRVGCDHYTMHVKIFCIISIHAPRVGCDGSRLPGAHGQWNFNPRTPCGVRPPPTRHSRRICWNFNPRTPCGVRLLLCCSCPGYGRFQSTHPVWGATANLYKVRGESLCSLHRLHSINSKCYNCGGEKISTPHTNWKNVCANLPGML